MHIFTIDPPIVHLSLGDVMGRTALTALSGIEYYSFQGMRYAKPPIGELRFKDPQPLDPWSGKYDASYERSSCVQYDNIGQEDCLFINVYTPKISSLFKAVQVLLPVMVWFHGGGYVAGSGNSDLFGPDFIVDNDVVLVTLNYRLGVFGFLNLRIDEVPGNAGLKDHVFALEWVQNNIEEFGGDPNDVTIFGESSGGSSVQFLMISPMAQGLFHKVISHSGSCLSHWIYNPNLNTVDKAIELVKLFGNSTVDSRIMLEILQNVTATELFEHANSLRTFQDVMRDSAFVFSPSIEKEFSNIRPFLLKPAIESFCSGNFSKIPYMAGFNSHEGIYYINYARIHSEYMKNLNNEFQYVVPLDMNIPINSTTSREVAQIVRKFYFGDKQVNESTIYNFIDLFTDYAFLEKVLFTSKLVRQHSNAPVYFYKFSFDGDYNSYKIHNDLKYHGSCHLDDLGYLFREDLNMPSKPGSISNIVRKRMVKMWTNFAKFGNPTPNKTELLSIKWEPTDKIEFKYLDINNTMTMKINPENERMLFWRNLYNTYSNDPSYVC